MEFVEWCDNVGVDGHPGWNLVVAGEEVFVRVHLVELHSRWIHRPVFRRKKLLPEQYARMNNRSTVIYIKLLKFEVGVDKLRKKRMIQYRDRITKRSPQLVREAPKLASTSFGAS